MIILNGCHINLYVEVLLHTEKVQMDVEVLLLHTENVQTKMGLWCGVLLQKIKLFKCLFCFWGVAKYIRNIFRSRPNRIIIFTVN